MMRQLPPGFSVIEGANENPALPQGFTVIEDGRDQRTRERYQQAEEARQVADFGNLSMGMNARNLLQAFNLNDEAAALNTQVGNVFRSEQDRLDPQLMAQLERDRVEQMRQARPVRAFAAEALGTVPLSAVRAPAAGVQALTGLARAGLNAPLRAAAATGAAAGGVSGAGAGETTQERLAGGAVGAGIGALLGPATIATLGLGGRAVNSGFRGVRRALGRGAAEAQERASPAAVRFANRAGVTDEIRRAPEALTGQGETFLAERLGSNTRQTATGLAGYGGQAQDAAEQAISTRAGGRAERVASAASQATQMEGRRPVDALMGLDEVRANAKPLFNEADRQIARVSPRLREAIRDLHRRGVDFKVADQVARDQDFAASGLSALADDIDALPERIPLGAVRALARTAEHEARGAFRSDSARSALAPGLENSARELRDYLRKVSPQYAEAARLWSSAARDDKAFDLGAAIFRPGARVQSDLQRFVTSGTSQTERRMFLAGVADAIEGRMGASSASGNAAAPLNRRLIRDRLNRFLGEDSASELMSTIDSEMAGARFEGLVLREVGSATEPRQAGRRRVERAAAGPVRSLLADLTQDVRGTLTAAGARRRVAEVISKGDDEAIAAVSRLLYSQGDVSDDPLAQAILREAARRNINIQAAQPLTVGAAATGQSRLPPNQ